MNALAGSLLVMLGGCCVAVFLLPLKFSKEWVWENQWMLGVAVMYLVLPLLEAVLFVPRTFELLRHESTAAVTWSFVAGLFQGSAGLLFAYGTVLMGVSMGYSVMVSIILVFATMIPLCVAHRERILSPSGILLLVGVALLISGAFMAGIAGKKRAEDRESQPEGDRQAKAASPGLLVFIALWVGATASANYLLMEWGSGVTARAEAAGVPQHLSTFVILFPWYIGMFTFNLVYCSWKMRKDKTWSRFWTGGNLAKEYALAVSIGLLWYLGQGVLLIAGYRQLGVLQVSIGSALFMGPVFIVSNLTGVLAGEWRGASRRTMRLLASATAVLIVAVMITQLGSYLGAKAS